MENLKNALKNLDINSSFSFEYLLLKLFNINVDEADNTLDTLDSNLLDNKFDFKNAIIYFTEMKKAQNSEHRHLGFILVPTTTHNKRELIKATKMINRLKENSNYNIIFFLGEDSSSYSHHSRNSKGLTTNQANSPKLSIAFATRRLHNNRIINTDIIEQITLIKDIDLYNPNIFHLNNLKSLFSIKPKEVNIYYDKLLRALRIKDLNKDFYLEIVEHFMEFKESLELPFISNDLENTKRAFVLRLISRILFCKFLEKKGLVPSEIWDTKLDTSYYHSVLEPLFFLTLNTKKEERDYSMLESRIVKLLDSIPYLNGGLFAPQSEDYFNPSNPHANINTLRLPNEPFIALFKTLDSYHFTIDEATADSREVGLDPEMLGMVFENLLSVLFTDNKADDSKLQDESMRKKTGSYYTPREIVSYMVRSSLLEYLVNATGIGREKLESFIKGSDSPLGNHSHNPPNYASLQRTISASHSHSEMIVRSTTAIARITDTNKVDSSNPAISLDSNVESNNLVESSQDFSLTTDEALALYNALESVKMLDPACGSGAFPMGILHEILNLKERLHYLISSAIDMQSLSANKIKQDSPFLKPFDIIKEKLNILQNNIYGVDIQPMATEISRLRCFLSLICDMPNEAITPLPNLEFKFLTANSLLPLPKNDSLSYDGFEADMEELERLRAENFKEHDKEGLQEKFSNLRNHIAKKLLGLYINVNASNAIDSKLKVESPSAIADKIKQSSLDSKAMPQDSTHPLLEWDPFDTQSVAKFFDSKFMFGLEGFDIVIGNPPYLDSENMIKNMYDLREKYKVIFTTTKGNWDIYVPFFELGLKLLSRFGVLAFITPDKWLSKPFGLELRKLIYSNLMLLHKLDNVFSEAKVDSVIVIATKKSVDRLKTILNNNVNIIEKNNILVSNDYIFDYFSKHIVFIQKLKSNNNKVLDIANCESACATADAYKLKPFIIEGEQICNQQYFKVINTGTIGKYKSKFGEKYMKYLGNSYLRPIVLKTSFNAHFKKYKNISQSKKLIIKGLTILDCCLDLNAEFIAGKTTIVIISDNDNILKLLCAIINSKLAFFYIKEAHKTNNWCNGINFSKTMIREIPIPKLDSSNQSLADEIIVLVDRILEIKQQDSTANTSELESKIDTLVYRLYNLTDEEIQIIEGGSK